MTFLSGLKLTLWQLRNLHSSLWAEAVLANSSSVLHYLSCVCLAKAKALADKRAALAQAATLPEETK